MSNTLTPSPSRSFPAIAALLIALAGARAVAGELPPGFVRLSEVAPGVEQDMRYAGANNFTGQPVPGYRAKGFGLVVYDCYRPRRAVSAFVDWSRDGDDRAKRDYYPRLDKRALFAQGYIAAKSGHSTGLAVDLGVKGWDFGAPFDYFDRRSWTKALVAREAHANRERLVALMRRHGFENYPREWWHFAFSGVKDAGSYDAEIE